MFTPEQLSIIRYCTDECIRQQSGMASVYNMINAWDWAAKQSQEIDVDFIDHLGRLVEPGKNIGGIRTTPISIGYEVREADRLPERLNTLIEAYYDGRLNPEPIAREARINKSWKIYSKYSKANIAEDIFYLEYEQIHPFNDGNGRTGKILYNYLRDSMDDPKMPPNFWGISNP